MSLFRLMESQRDCKPATVDGRSGPSGITYRKMRRMPRSQSYYVYALKDPRTSPALPFYVGKGTGTRSYDHLAKADRTRKGERIKEIEASGARVLVTRLVDGLDELHALRLEAELISALGTLDSGGLLTNAVIPSGVTKRAASQTVLPSGVREKAQLGLALLKEAVLELAKANPGGVSNSDVASLLGLRSDYGGGSKDYLSYSILGILLREGKLDRPKGGKKHVTRVP